MELNPLPFVPQTLSKRQRQMSLEDLQTSHVLRKDETLGN